MHRGFTFHVALSSPLPEDGLEGVLWAPSMKSYWPITSALTPTRRPPNITFAGRR